MEWLRKMLGPSKADLEVRRQLEEARLPKKSKGAFDLELRPNGELDLDLVRDIAFGNWRPQEVNSTTGRAMDEAPCIEMPSMGYRFNTRGGIPDNVVGWFVSQAFIGYPMCAIMAQNWLINRACKIPAEDATRNGWEIEGLDQEQVDELEALDKAWDIKRKCQEMARFTRVFGVRIALFCVDSTDPLYYEKPFNPDSIKPGSYRGISQIDPNWCSPEFNQRDMVDPAGQDFFEPTWWRVGMKRYHKSHLVITRYVEVPDLLKPNYLFGGVSLPQLLWERVYAAERSANEGPQLLLTKRMNVLKTDLDAAVSDPENFRQKNQLVSEQRDNYGQMAIGTEDEYEQHETSLGDFDSVVMTEYQLCAGIAEMPATKLIGTTPKGFNSTGDYESNNYRETCSTIQEHHCTPLLTRHYLCATRSLGIEGTVKLVWNPLDEPTEEAIATTSLVRAQTRQIYQDLGAVSQEQTAKVVKNDSSLGYDFEEEDDGDEDDLYSAILSYKPRAPVQPKVPASNEGPGEGVQGEAAESA